MVIDDKYYPYRVGALSVTEERRRNARLKPFDLEVGEIVKTSSSSFDSDDSGARLPQKRFNVYRYRVLAIYNNIFHCVLLDDDYQPKWKESFRKLDFQLGEVIRNSEAFSDSRTKTKQS